MNSPDLRPAWRAAVLALLAAAAGCTHEEPWGLTNISGLMPPLQFDLTTEHDQTVKAADFRGRVVLLYFGYTHCPDVCPTTLAKLSMVLKQLGPTADAVRVLFVTVDPDRDTPELLRKYVKAFGPQFVGLKGSEGALRTLTKRYRVAYSLDKPDTHGDYAVSHSSAVFIFDRKGNVRLLAQPTDSVDTISGDLRRLAGEQ